MTFTKQTWLVAALVAAATLMAAPAARPRNAGIVAESVHRHLATIEERVREIIARDLEAVGVRQLVNHHDGGRRRIQPRGNDVILRAQFDSRDVAEKDLRAVGIHGP